MRFKYRSMVLTSLLLTVAMLLSACGGSGEGDGSGEGEGSEEPIKIGAIFDVTGPTSDVGKPYSEGIKSFVKWKNENGGIEGRQIELISDDYGYKVPRAEELYTQFVTQDNVVAFSGWGTGDSEALKGKVSEDKIPFISASYSIQLGNPAETPYNFLVGTNYSDQLVIAQKWALEDWASKGNGGAPKFAYLHHDSPFGKSPLPEGEAHAEANGVETLAVPSPGGATDLIPQLTQINEFGANYVFLQNVSSPASLAIRNAQEQGLTENMQFVCLNWCANNLLISLSGDAGEGVVGAIPFAPPSSGAEGAKQALDYASTNNIAVDDEILFVQGWWSMAILVEGIERAAKEGGELTGEKIKSAMEGMSGFETGGVTAPITFSASDHSGNKSLKLYRVEGGAWNPITEVLSAE